MRVFGNFIWLAYSIELRAFLFIISNIVSLFSSMFVCYYKIIDIYNLKDYDNALIIYNKVIENDDNDKENANEDEDENGF